uniref:hypothetical protein n=1 Tax=Candidatus Limisoma sp. TaxID=3076476 RepID=UPI004025C24E
LTLYPCSNPRFPRTASGAEQPTQHAPQRGAAEAQACFCFLDKNRLRLGNIEASLILLFG